MEKRNIIVVVASTGGFEAVQQLVAALPATPAATIFIAWHMSPGMARTLPQALNRQRTMPATTAIDNELIRTNHIYVAAPDKRLVPADGLVRVTRVTREN